MPPPSASARALRVASVEAGSSVPWSRILSDFLFDHEVPLNSRPLFSMVHPLIPSESSALEPTKLKTPFAVDALATTK